MSSNIIHPSHFKTPFCIQTAVATPDPTQNLPFNLSLTSSQQKSRAQVPLPYAHEGKVIPISISFTRSDHRTNRYTGNKQQPCCYILRSRFSRRYRRRGSG